MLALIALALGFAINPNHFRTFACPFASRACGAPVKRQADRLLTMFTAALPRLHATFGNMLIAAGVISILLWFASSMTMPLLSIAILLALRSSAFIPLESIVILFSFASSTSMPSAFIVNVFVLSPSLYLMM